MNRRLKVLIEAYECSPLRDHAAGSAWQILTRLSASQDLWAITESRYKKEIDGYFASGGTQGSGIVFHYVPRAAKRGAKGYHSALPVAAMLRYRKWLGRSYKTALELNQKIRFDLTHHLRGCTFREPGYFWRMPAPLIWGPMGGTGCLPWSMMPVLGLRGLMAHSVKNVVNAIQLRFSRRVNQAVHRACTMLAQTTQDKENLRKVHGVDAQVVHEQSCDPSLGCARHFDGYSQLKIAWAGRCLPLKGLPIILKAMSNPCLRNRVSLHVAGTGPKLRDWQLLSERLGIADACSWHGWLSKEEMLTMFGDCHVFAFPSLLEGTPASVTQALSTGLPVICLKHCGFGDVVDHTCGLTISVTDPKSVVMGFSRSLLAILQEPRLVERLSHGAIDRAQLYSWDNTVSLICRAYEDAVQLGPVSRAGQVARPTR